MYCCVMEEYRSTIKARSFLFLELKKAANLYARGISLDEINEKALKENIFLLNTENRIKEIAATISERLAVLDKRLLSKLISERLETSKQIALYTILKTDRLFLEFMLEVYQENYLMGNFIIQDGDFDIFFQRKAEQSERVAGWQDYTLYKLKQVYKRILIEAGLAQKNKKGIEIIKPLIEDEIIYYLHDKGEDIYLRAMLGGQ